MTEAESRPEEPLPVYFLHIAKTGGTSLTAALKAFYRAGEVITEGAIFRSSSFKLRSTDCTQLFLFTATRNMGLCLI
jgi:hypothetical protein